MVAEIENIWLGAEDVGLVARRRDFTGSIPLYSHRRDIVREIVRRIRMLGCKIQVSSGLRLR